MGQCLCFKWAVITSGGFLCRTTCRDCGETLTSPYVWLHFEDALTPIAAGGEPVSNEQREMPLDHRVAEAHVSHHLFLCILHYLSGCLVDSASVGGVLFAVHFQPLISSDHAALLAPYFSELSLRSTFITHVAMKWTGYEKSICANHSAEGL